MSNESDRLLVLKECMQSASQSGTEEVLVERPLGAETSPRRRGWLQSRRHAVSRAARLKPFGYSLADQALAVGGNFLVNVVLARTQSKEEYGMFALSYSFYVFLTSIHNSIILEPYTVYGSGRCRESFSEYLRLMLRCNVFLGLALNGILLLACLFLWVLAPQRTSGAFLGLALTVSVLFSGLFLRRVFYLQRQAELAAGTSLVFLGTISLALWLAAKTHLLNSFSAFVVLAMGWLVAGAAFGRKLSLGNPKQRFLELEPGYWQTHWNYTRWVLATAFVFQFATQGYYWLLAGILSVKEVGELRAMYLVVGPVEQVLVAVSFILLPALAARYAARKMGDLLMLWKRYVLATIGLTGVFAVAVRYWGKSVLHMLYAGKFDDLTPLLYLMALSPLLVGIGNSMVNALNAVEKPKFAFYGFLCSAAATFLGGIPLVMHFGLRGAVYGMLLSGATYCSTLTIGFWFKVYNKAPQQACQV